MVRSSFFWANLIILLLVSSTAGANGGPYYFDKILEKVDGGWLGYRVMVLDVTSFSIAIPEIGRKVVYDLTYEWSDTLEKNIKSATFLPLSKPGIYNLHDMGSFKRIKPDEVGLPDATVERYIWFRRDELNRGAVLAFIPMYREVAPMDKISMMGLDASLSHLEFLGGVQPDENNRFRLGNTDARFRFAIDRQSDGTPDLVVFDATEGYTRTYLLGRTPEGWMILWIGFPV